MKLLFAKIRCTRAVTLLELIISLGMLAVLVGIFAYTYYSTLKNNSFQVQRFDLKQEAVWALENISRDLHQAVQMTVAGANTMTFQISPYETVQYSLVTVGSTQQLIRTYTFGSTTKTSSVAKNVLTFALEYYDSSGSVTAVLANIRLVKITLVVQSTWWTNSEAWTLRTNVAPRNL